MAKSRRLHPQFFHTLVNGFHTHLTIPVDFFSKYVEGKSLEKTAAELKSDGSDITWEVKMTDRRLSEGWEVFAVAHDLQIGDVVLVRYEGDMVFYVSDLGPNWCEIPSKDNDGQDDIGRSLLKKKRLFPRTQVDFSSNDDDSIELPRKKKVKKNSPEAEAEAVSSSSSDKSCFVAIVTASNLLSDKLYLPQHFTSSNGLTRNCRKIVIIDGGERSWLLDLRFDESTDTFYISRRWRSFCDENSQKAGGFFRFKLVGNGETPVLSFCLEESINDISQRDCSEASQRESLSTELSNKDIDSYIEPKKIRDIETCYTVSKEERRSWEKEKSHLRGRDSTPSSQKAFVTLTVTPYSVEKCLRSLPRKFTRENDINEPGMITLLGRDGIKQQTKLHLNKVTRSMNLGDGWRYFVEANGLKMGNSFTFKLIWEDRTPVLSLCCDREQEEFSKAAEKKSLVIDPSKKENMRKTGNNKEKKRSVEREKNRKRRRVSTPSSHKEFVTLTITPYSVEKNILRLPRKFTRENEINKPGMVTLLGKDGMKQQTKLHLNKVTGIMTLGNGWKDFVKANGLKTGDSFTLKLIWEGTTPVLSLCPGKSSIDRGGEGECSETNQKKSLPIDDSNEKSNIEEGSKKQNNVEETIKGERSLWQREYNLQRCINSTSPSQNRFLTITITPEILQDKRMRLPRKFVMENGMDKAGMVYLLGKDGKKWATNLAGEKDGRMSLGNGWVVFAEANECKPGETFTLELIWEDETPMLRFLSTESNSTKANNQESMISTEDTEPRKRDSSPAIGNRSVTLTLAHEDVRACKLHLPIPFMRDNGINKLGKMTILGENGMELSAYLLSRDGTVALENGWEEFCEANGVKLGESFTVESLFKPKLPQSVFCLHNTIYPPFE